MERGDGERLPRRILVGLLALLGRLAGVSLVIAFTFGRGSSADSQVRAVHDVPRWIQQEHLPHRAVWGAALFAVLRCTVCHTYAGSGQTSLGAPDLTAIGTRKLGIRFQVDHLRCPACVNPGSPMPAYRSLSDRRLHQLAVFLEESKGIR